MTDSSSWWPLFRADDAEIQDFMFHESLMVQLLKDHGDRVCSGKDMRVCDKCDELYGNCRAGSDLYLQLM